MYTLCFLSGMDSTEIAAWVQAIGSILAIAAAAWVAIYQAKKQHESAMDVYKTERRHAKTELAKTLAQLAVNCRNAVGHIAANVTTPDAVEKIVTGKEHIDIAMLRSLELALESVPLINLPAELVSQPLILHGAIRQFRENVEYLLEKWRFINKDEYRLCLAIIEAVKASLEATCEDILHELKRFHAEA